MIKNKVGFLYSFINMFTFPRLILTIKTMGRWQILILCSMC